MEFSTTTALDRPLAGRIFSGQLIRDNPGIGRPDTVNLLFGRTIRQRGKRRTPGTFRTQVITHGACPCLYLSCKKTQDGQYLKEGRALRTETTLSQPRDLGTGKELTNLAAMAKAGYAASRRLPDAGCISHDPAAGTAALSDAHQPGHLHHLHPRPRHPLPRPPRPGRSCRPAALALRPAGFTSRDLRHLLAPQPGKDPEDMTGGQISYDLRRLRDCQIIERIPHSRSYQVTADGLSTALFFTRLTRRVIIPALAQIAGTSPPSGSPLRQADRACKAAIADLAAQASLATQPRPSPSHSRQAPAVTPNPS